MKKITLFTMAVLAAISLTNAQTVITVDNSPGSNAQFNDLQSAISQAQDGDIIQVHPSEITYGDIDVNKPLTILGFSHSSSQKRTSINQIFLRNNASNTTLSGLSVTDFISTNDNTTTLENIVIENCFVDDIFFNDAGMNNLIFRGNIVDRIGTRTNATGSNNYSNALITNNIITGAVHVKSFQNTTVKNNIFLGPDIFTPIFNVNDESGNLEVQNCIFFYNTSSAPDPNDPGITFSNCLTFNLSSGQAVALQGTDNLDNIDPLFNEDNDNTTFEPLLDNYVLLNNSLAKGAGINGEDLGIFDGSGFVFDNVGFTDGIPTVNIQAISTTVAPGQSLNVIINTSNQ